MERTNKWENADVESTSFSPLDRMHYNKAKNRGGGMPEEARIRSGLSNSTNAINDIKSIRVNSQGLKQNTLNKVSSTRQDYFQHVSDLTEHARVQSYSNPARIPIPNSMLKEAALRKEATSGTQPVGSVTNTVHLAPQLYSPLFLNANLQLPRDILTANAWNRAFYETNPIVRNAINLHSTYPISKMSIKCEDPEVETFFLNMVDKLDLERVIQSVSSEFWTIGECFVYADFDESTGSWSKVYIHNPDFISVKASPIPGTQNISLKPDPELEKIITGNDPSLAKIRESLDPRIVHHVLMNEYIPLDNFNISHLKSLSSPYNVRGSSIIVSVWKDLIHYDKLREAKLAQADGMINPLTQVKVGASNADGHYPTSEELEVYRELLECHDVETEVLTTDGFKNYKDIMTWEEDADNNIINVKMIEGIKVACFNSENKQLEYFVPERATLYNYDGEMYYFNNDEVNIKVTPSHRMWVSEEKDAPNNFADSHQMHWNKFKLVEAKDINQNKTNRFQSIVGWTGNEDIKFVEVCGNLVPIELYLEYLGYLISETDLYKWDAEDCTVGITQVFDKSLDKIQCCVDKFTSCIDQNYSSKPAKEGRAKVWKDVMNGKSLYEHFGPIIGGELGKIYIPRWILNLSTNLLSILLKALTHVGGTRQTNHDKLLHLTYHSISKQLADDIYEIAYKCGQVPSMSARDDNSNYIKIYIVEWRHATNNNMPIINEHNGIVSDEERQGSLIKENYADKVWCLTVPTGLFVTRRNGKITIQGNSAQYDHNFSLVTHDAVDISRIGYTGTIVDTTADFQWITDNVLMGLMIPKAIITQEGATYASASVALDVMRQRYNNFRTMMANWLEQKIFAPISEVQGFYKPVEGVKKLIVPKVEWNHMTLYDLDNYLQHITGMVEKKDVSLETVYRSLGLNRENEMSNIRREQIEKSILAKESEQLQSMSLTELRALDPTKPVPERLIANLPGTPGGPASSAEQGGDKGGGLMGGAPGGLGGGLGGGFDSAGLDGGMMGGPGGDLGTGLI